ncbi:MAG: hypothetical protein KAJ19_18900 [Gammaproteobacteria bacterium]|nr:hypothetical protein [Gammaproteobacteria bacterium]
MQDRDQRTRSNRRHTVRVCGVCRSEMTITRRNRLALVCAPCSDTAKQLGLEVGDA